MTNDALENQHIISLNSSVLSLEKHMQTMGVSFKGIAPSAKRFSILAVLIGLAFSSLACSSTSRTAATSATPTSVAKVLGKFEPIEGTDYLVAPILPAISSSYSYSSYDSSSSWGVAYNYVFLNRTNDTFQQLLPTNEYVITFTEPLALPDANAETLITHWWLYGIIKSDTNGDKALTLEDRITLAISDVGGTGYTEIITDVDEVYGHTLRDETTLLIIYRSNDHKYLTGIDLPGRSIVATAELPSLGSDVK